MKAALLKEIRKAFEIVDVPEPEIAPDEVLIETHTCGICRTDIHILDGLAYVPNLPHIPGHEPAGVIVQTWSEVAALKTGDRVVPHLFVNDSDCYFTRSGQQAQATHLKGIIGVTMPGGFAEYFKAPARNLIMLPDEVDFEFGGLTSCAVITAVHAYRRSELQANKTALVLGAGGIGLMLVQLLANAGVRTVAAIRSERSRQLALEAGAAIAVPVEGEEAAAQVREFADPDKGGVDCVFEMVGLNATMKAASNFCARGGKIIVIGEEAEVPGIDTIQIAQRELKIIGSRNGGLQDAIDSLQMMAQGIIKPHISERFSLDAFNEAITRTRNCGSTGRVIITMK